MILGDLVKVINPEDRYYEKTFTVSEISLLSRYVRCIRSQMKYGRSYHISELEVVKSKPKFEIGDVVVHNIPRFCDADDNGFGIVINSNRLGSIIRRRYDNSHEVSYICNRHLRKI